MAITVRDTVVRVIASHFGVEFATVADDTNFVETFNPDDLDNIELVMDLEETFNIEIPDGDLEKPETVGDAIKYIEGKIA
jgi:acyl carrier protein